MAGSLKYFEYTTDSGDVFAILADESNCEALNGETSDYDADSTVAYHLPGNVKPRYGVFSNAAKTRNLKVPIFTPAAYLALIGSDTAIADPIAGTGTLGLTRLVPEKISLLPIAADSGLIDGDAT